MAYTLKTKLANKANYGGKRSTDKIKFIVLHFTANDGDTDENNGKYFANNVVKSSAHYFVDDDSVTQSVPDNYVAYSVGGKKYNDCAKTGGGKYYGKCTNTNSLNIELCDDVKNGTIYPSSGTIANALELTKAKMKEYDIPASNVIRHFDVNGKKCPAYWVDDSKWKSEFWNKLASTSAETAQKPTNATQTVKDTTSSVYSLAAFIKDVQRATGATVDGIAGKETLSKTPTVSSKINNRHAVVKAIQKRLNELGFDCGKVDGIAGSKFTSAVKKYQTSKGCVADGEITARHRTWQHLLGII
jgi:N-acetylmuramoyl-L-alanine amidase CwlA